MCSAGLQCLVIVTCGLDEGWLDQSGCALARHAVRADCGRVCRAAAWCTACPPAAQQAHLPSLSVSHCSQGRNLVYCAPTSGGKSLVAEVLMLRRILTTNRPAMLVLPFVSICSEKSEHLRCGCKPAVQDRACCHSLHAPDALLRPMLCRPMPLPYTSPMLCPPSLACSQQGAGCNRQGGEGVLWRQPQPGGADSDHRRDCVHH